MLRLLLFVCLGLSVAYTGHAQDKARLYGTVKDEKGNPLQQVSVLVLELNSGVPGNDNGAYSLELPANRNLRIIFRYIGHEEVQQSIRLKPGEQKLLDVVLKTNSIHITDITVEDRQIRTTGVVKLDPKVSSSLANPTGNFEMLLQAAGARPTQELSSQYTVRGGNFDENLVYVNDIEIYRPVLVRSGQQEGMSFINPDMVGSIQFSAGGFEARYGDKLSSVLDVRYRRPETFRTTVQAGLMGANLTTEGRSNNKKLSWLIGGRYRTLSNLLGSLDTQGEYRPVSTDVQGYFGYTASPKWEYGLLLSYNQNDYTVVPANRETVFGTVREALQLRVFFDGQEVTQFRTFTAGATATYKPFPRMQLKFIGSAYTSDERENFDVEGAWLLNQLDTEIGSENFGKVAFTRGIGGFQDYARNQLTVQVYALEHKGYYQSLTYGYLQWGLRVQQEYIADRLTEWKNIDSAAFALPGGQPARSDVVNLYETIYAANRVNASRISGYVQDSYLLNDLYELHLTAGMRFNYWTYSNELLVSPRAEISFKPRWERDWVFRAAAGLYGQPAFYREMRDPFGTLNPAIRAQRAIHYVAGGDYSFKAWDRPFRFVTELFYKDMYSIVPYELDNVRLRYLGQNNARAYAQGIDFRINGEFVYSLQSWASLSFLKTGEDISGDFYTNPDGSSTGQEVGYIPRPSDQRMIFNIMFQDYLPVNPSYRVHLNVVYGSRLPYGPPDYDRSRDTLRMPPYRRVDIGFAKQLVGSNTKRQPKGAFWKSFRSIWLNAEVFNLLQVNNTISYLWIVDTEGFQQAVPNYLTARTLNLRLIAEF